MALRIGEVAERSGTSTAAIRYYESIGLLKPPQRSEAGYRRYSNRAVEEVQFIRKAQLVGFSLDEVREILQLSRAGRRPCDRVKTIVERHLRAIDQRLEEIGRFRHQLAAHLDEWRREGSAPAGAVVCGWIQSLDESTMTGGMKLTSRRRPNGSARARTANKEKH
jgi:MerR family copper efflux transcriptional regulator